MNIFDLSFPELEAQLIELGQPKYRAKQIWQNLYINLAGSFDEMTSLPKSLRQTLTERFRFGSLTELISLTSSDKSTTKNLFQLQDGQQIETVLMTYDKRRTVCFSTQAGCAMGCVFCATGQMGFERNLTVGEIVEQVLWFARQLKAKDDRLTNLVVMGMGEPFHNYDKTMAALDRLMDDTGYNFGARRITLSTVGLIPAIERFTAEKRRVNLAVSLHAATDDLRTELVPLNKRYPIADLIAACRNYVEQSGRRITFELALIANENDTPEQANALGRLLKGLLCHVNVIPLNPTTDYAGEKSNRDRVDEFKRILENYGVTCTIRMRRGIDINAGCGQLRKTTQTELLKL